MRLDVSSTMRVSRASFSKLPHAFSQNKKSQPSPVTMAAEAGTRLLNLSTMTSGAGERAESQHRADRFPSSAWHVKSASFTRNT